MSVSAFMGLQTALRGLMATQDAIETTGNNITNASTPGYSRETVDMTSADPLTLAATGVGSEMQLGTGVDVNQIRRVRDQFLDLQYRTQNSIASGASTQSQTLQQVQTGLAEPSDHGLSAQLQQFWSAWNDVANNPTDPAAREAVVAAGQSLSQTFNALDSQLAGVQNQAAGQYSALTGSGGQVATDAQQIASLNVAIHQAQLGGANANTLEDQRDKLIDDLSSLAKVSVTDTGDGMVQVGFGDAATPLVSGATVTWPQTLGTTSAGPGGQLGALLSLSQPGGQIAGYMSTLDGIAGGLISSVNALTSQGQPSTQFFSGSNASTIVVNPSLVSDPSTLPTSTTGLPGDNDTALAIAGLSGGATDGNYAAFVAQVGGDAAAAQATQQTSQAVLSSVDNQRQSVSGVSLDEEMTNLITFQRGYQASARVMTTVDQMLDTLINHTGMAGL